MKKRLFFLSLLSLPLLSLADVTRIPLSPDLAIITGQYNSKNIDVIITCKDMPIKRFALQPASSQSLNTTGCVDNNIISGKLAYQPVPFASILQLEIEYQNNGVVETQTRTFELQNQNY